MLISTLMLLLLVTDPRSAEVNEAVAKVKQIVNQPVESLPRAGDVAVFSPGWFHEGALTPDFRNVDVRRSQETPYARYEYVSSDLNPGAMFRGRDLEFNPMTKYFYTDRSLPKKHLTEEEMVELNRLYRIIAGPEPQAAAPPPPERVTPTKLGYVSGGVLLVAAVLWLRRRRSQDEVE